MKARIILLLFGSCLLFTSFRMGEKVIFIYIDQKLAQAKTIQLVKVHAYTNSSLVCVNIKSNDTLRINARYSKEIRLNEKSTIGIDENPNNEWAGKWPAIGQEVLMVTDSLNRPRLFAFKIGNDYRFWDPYSGPFANSVFWFPNKQPYKQLPLCLEINTNRTEFWNCTDGCLVDKAFIKERK